MRSLNPSTGCIVRKLVLEVNRNAAWRARRPLPALTTARYAMFNEV